MKKMQEQSFQHHTQKSLEERWIHTNYVPATSTQAEVNIMFLISLNSKLISNL